MSFLEARGHSKPNLNIINEPEFHHTKDCFHLMIFIIVLIFLKNYKKGQQIKYENNITIMRNLNLHMAQ